MNRRTVDTRLSSAPTRLIKREPGNEAMLKPEQYHNIRVCSDHFLDVSPSQLCDENT